MLGVLVFILVINEAFVDSDTNFVYFRASIKLAHQVELETVLAPFNWCCHRHCPAELLLVRQLTSGASLLVFKISRAWSTPLITLSAVLGTCNFVALKCFVICHRDWTAERGLVVLLATLNHHHVFFGTQLSLHYSDVLAFAPMNLDHID